MIETMTGKTLTVNGSFDIAELKERIRQLDGTPVDLQQFTTVQNLWKIAPFWMVGGRQFISNGSAVNRESCVGIIALYRVGGVE
jgi:hypothetical protein